jgi:site-specific DNA recombinase
VPASEVKDDLARIAARREALEAQLTNTGEAPVLVHPRMAEVYRTKVAGLAAALTAEQDRAEAADILRSLIAASC